MTDLPSREQMESMKETDVVKSWRSLLMTYKMIFSILESSLQRVGCTVPRLQVFFVLYFEGPMVPVKLARRLMVTRGNMSTLLKRMIDERLVEPCVETGTESRPAYKLSEHGEQQFLKFFPTHVSNLDELIPVFNDEMYGALYRVQKQVFDLHGIGTPISGK